jgi:hypothetical protein
MITVSHDKELDAAIYTIEGDVEYAEVRDAIDRYYKGALTKYTIWDYSKANRGKHLTGDETQKLGIQVSSLGVARPQGFDLLIVPNIVQYGLARMYQAYSEIAKKDTKTLKSKIFRNREDAIAFIRQNERLLKATQSL